jgi:hypothetical protein
MYADNMSECSHRQSQDLENHSLKSPVVFDYSHGRYLRGGYIDYG